MDNPNANTTYLRKPKQECAGKSPNNNIILHNMNNNIDNKYLRHS